MERKYEATDSEEADQLISQRTIKEIIGKNWINVQIEPLWLDGFEVIAGKNKYLVNIPSFDDAEAVFGAFAMAALNLYDDPEEIPLSSFNKLSFCSFTSGEVGDKLVVKNEGRHFVFRSAKNQPLQLWSKFLSFFFNSDKTYYTIYMSYYLALRNGRHELVEKYLCVLGDLVKISSYCDWAVHCKQRCKQF